MSESEEIVKPEQTAPPPPPPRKPPEIPMSEVRIFRHGHRLLEAYVPLDKTVRPHFQGKARVYGKPAGPFEQEAEEFIFVVRPPPQFVAGTEEFDVPAMVRAAFALYDDAARESLPEAKRALAARWEAAERHRRLAGLSDAAGVPASQQNKIITAKG